MNIALALLSMGVVVAISYFAAAMTNRRVGAKKRTKVAASTRIPLRGGRTRIRWIDSTQLSRLIDSDPELVIFRLVKCHVADEKSGESSRLPGQLVVTLKELEETLSWIPRGSRVAVYRLSGIGWVLRLRLSKILRGREAMLLSSASEFAGQLNRLAGGRCN